jgi:hypothetical protein
VTAVGAEVPFLIEAPLPSGDSTELPITLVTIIFAKTLYPHSKLYGAWFKTEFGIVQALFATITAFVPLQFTLSSVNVVKSL